MSDAFRQGSHASDSVSALKSFWAYATTNKISTIRLAGMGTGYQVTAAKTLHLTRLTVASNSGNATVAVSVGYGDTDIGFDSAADPTSYTKLVGNNHIGSTTADQTPFAQASTTGTVGTFTFNILIDVPATKYPTIFVTNASAVYLEGFES